MMAKGSAAVPLSYNHFDFVFTYKETDKGGITLAVERTSRTHPWREDELELSACHPEEKISAVLILCKFVCDGGTMGNFLQKILKRLLAEYSTDEKFALCVCQYLNKHCYSVWKEMLRNTLTCAQVMEFVLPYGPWGVTVPLKSRI
jgi:hypothetical protein